MLKKLLFISLFSAAAYAAEFNLKPSADFFLDGISIQKDKYGNIFFSLREKIFSDTELFLDFENSDSDDLREHSGNYRIARSSYTPADQNSPDGKYHASFAGKTSSIIIPAYQSQLLGSSIFKSDFFVSFYIYTNRDGVIMKKIYYSRGNKYGMVIERKNGFIQVRLINMVSESGQTRSFTITGNKKLPENKWELVTFYLDPGGKLVLYHGESMTAYREIRYNNAFSIGYHPNDTTPMKIGGEYYGFLDRILVKRGRPDLSELTRSYNTVSTGILPSQDYGVIKSEVHRTEFSNSIPRSFRIRETVPTGSSIEHYVRFSNSAFSMHSEEIPWINHNAFEKKSAKIRFKYFQWMAKIKPDPEGLESPRLSEATLSYQLHKPPARPSGIKILSASEESLSICLGWISNHEKDVQQCRTDSNNVRHCGGYMIHYGFTRDKMAGILAIDKNGNNITGLEQDKKLTDSYRSLNLCIDNGLITKNAELHQNQDIPVFRKGLTYYFKITAYNNRYNTIDSKDQKSIPSKTVFHTFRSR